MVQAECPRGPIPIFSSSLPKGQTPSVIQTIQISYEHLAHPNKSFLTPIKLVQFYFSQETKLQQTEEIRRLCETKIRMTHIQKFPGTSYSDSFKKTKKHSVLNRKVYLYNNMLFLIQKRRRSKKKGLAIFDLSNIFIYNMIISKRTLMTKKHSTREVATYVSFTG